MPCLKNSATVPLSLWPCRVPLPSSKQLGLVDYEPTWRAMQSWAAGDIQHEDQLWFLQHSPVYTMGQNSDTAHLLNPRDIPVIDIDRGGQVTYHGPGQLVVYPLLTLDSYQVGIRSLVTLLETSMINTLAEFDITASAKPDAPGVYVGDSKIGSIGLRIKNGRCYHGLALNVNMDLAPFSGINPCGYAQLKMTQMSDLHSSNISIDQVSPVLENAIQSLLSAQMSAALSN